MAQRFATVEVRQKLKSRIADIEACKSNPTAWSSIQDKSGFLDNEERLKATLNHVTPPDLNGEEQDTYRNRLSMLTEALTKGKEGIVVPMPSHRQCWDNAPGTAGQILKWGNFWKHNTLDPEGHIVKAERGKGAIWEAKDLLRTINKAAEGEDPDVASLEMIRPKNDMDPLSEVARRSYAFSPQFKENYDQVFPEHKKTDVEEKVDQAANEQVEKLMARIQELESLVSGETKKKGMKSETRKAQSERMKARWAARKAAKESQSIGA
jgi:hypothetical protein